MIWEKYQLNRGETVHLSEENIARLMLDYYPDVGRHLDRKQVWNAKPETMAVGLLRLLVRELRATRELLERQDEQAKHEERMERHREWLVCYRDEYRDLHKTFHRHVDRIVQLSGWKWPLPSGMRAYGYNYVPQEDYGYSAVSFLRDRLEVLKQVKSIDDMLLIEGIGKVRVQKLKEQAKSCQDETGQVS